MYCWLCQRRDQELVKQRELIDKLYQHVEDHSVARCGQFSSGS